MRDMLTVPQSLQQGLDQSSDTQPEALSPTTLPSPPPAPAPWRSLFPKLWFQLESPPLALSLTPSTSFPLSS